jgi:hypothetical protein
LWLAKNILLIRLRGCFLDAPGNRYAHWAFVINNTTGLVNVQVERNADLARRSEEELGFRLKAAEGSGHAPAARWNTTLLRMSCFCGNLDTV